LATSNLLPQGELFSMTLFHFARAVSASPTEKIMHAIHEGVGWAVLALVAAVLAVGGMRTYLLYRRTETELAATVQKTPILREILHVHQNCLRPVYRRLFVAGVIAFCSSVYNRFEVGFIDRLNYAAASAVQKLSILLHRYVDIASIDGLNYLVAEATKKFSDLFFKHAELSGVDRFNYLIADGAVRLSSRFRKTHTGVLSNNMILVGFAFILFLVLSLYVGGFLK